MQDIPGVIPERPDWVSLGKRADEHRALRESLTPEARERLDADFHAELIQIEAVIGEDFHAALERAISQTTGNAHEERVEECVKQKFQEPIAKAIGLLRSGADTSMTFHGCTATAICARHPLAFSLLEELLDRGASPWAKAGTRFSGALSLLHFEPASVAVDSLNPEAVRLLGQHGAFNARALPDFFELQASEPWAALVASFKTPRWMQTAIALAQTDLPSWTIGSNEGFTTRKSVLASAWMMAGNIAGLAGVEQMAEVAPLPDETNVKHRGWALNELLNGSDLLRQKNEKGAQAIRDYFAKMKAKTEAEALSGAISSDRARAQGGEERERGGEPKSEKSHSAEKAKAKNRL